MLFENLNGKDFRMVIVEEAVRLIEAELGSALEISIFLPNEGILAEVNAKFAFFGDSL